MKAKWVGNFTGMNPPVSPDAREALRIVCAVCQGYAGAVWRDGDRWVLQSWAEALPKALNDEDLAAGGAILTELGRDSDSRFPQVMTTVYTPLVIGERFYGSSSYDDPAMKVECPAHGPLDVRKAHVDSALTAKPKPVRRLVCPPISTATPRRPA